MKKNKENRINMATVIMIGMLFLGFFSTCYQIAAKNIGYDILGFDEDWFLKSIVSDTNFDAPKQAEFVWSEEYPFAEDTAYDQRQIVDTATRNYTNTSSGGKIGRVYEMLEKYTRDYFSFNGICERVSKQFGIFMGNTLNVDAYGRKQLFLSNGHMTYERPYKSVDNEVYNIKCFAKWLKEEGIDYFHVVIPGPVSPEEEVNVQARGYQVYSNQMADELVTGIETAGIKYLDLRDCMEIENKSYTDYFFQYEHHMVPEGGLWAAGKISDYINEIENISSDSTIFDINEYTITRVEKSNGLMNNKLLVYEGKENMDLLHPLFDTNFKKYISDYDLVIEGTFDDVMYAMFSLPTYSTWNHGINAIKTYRNRNIDDVQPKILLLTESYSEVISPFLACSYANVDEIDLRTFSGSLQCYIEETQPDLVVSIYSAYDLNSNGAEALFEFK